MNTYIKKPNNEGSYSWLNSNTFSILKGSIFNCFSYSKLVPELCSSFFSSFLKNKQTNNKTAATTTKKNQNTTLTQYTNAMIETNK